MMTIYKLTFTISHSIHVGIHKHYSVEEWGAFAKANPELISYVAVSAGSGEEDFLRMQQIVALVDAKFICLDVANGYSEHASLFIYSFIHLFI